MKRQAAYMVAVAGYLALLALVVSWHAWLYPSRYFPTALVLLVTAVPMLPLLRGLLHGRPRSHLWASFLMLLYFLHGVVEAYANPLQRLPALAEVALSLIVFISAALFTRWTMVAAATEPGRA